MSSRVYLGMQCFWGESAFAKLIGVVGTRVGYAGGTTIAPTYKDIGDHTEVTEVTYDPAIISYSKILDYFWSHHDPTIKNKKQYKSAILWNTEEEKKKAEESLDEHKKKYTRELDTYVVKLDKFHQAEDYHQKYWLRSRPAILKQLNLTESEIPFSKLAAKMNAYLAGYDNFTELNDLAREFSLSEDLVKLVTEIGKNGGDPRACH